jgi:DUF2905 family protein
MLTCSKIDWVCDELSSFEMFARESEAIGVSNFSDVGKLLLLIGGGIVLLGLFMLVAGRIPFLGRLPGDIFVRRGSGTFYFPVVTCLIVSVVLTIVVNVVLFLIRRH